MIDRNETTFLQEGLVKITNRRALIGTTTYSMADITSVNVTKRARSGRPLWLVATGTVLVLWSIVDQTGYYREFFNIGIALILVGFAVLVISKPTYAVQIQGRWGKYNILRSTDPSFIQRVASAMNHAITGRVEAAHGRGQDWSLG